MLKAIGANWTRLHDAGLDYIGWYHLEPRKGQWRAITTGEGFLHAQGAAIAALAGQIEDHHFTRRVKAAEGVWAYLFQADDGSRAVALLAPEESHGEYLLPAGALDLFGNPLAERTPIGKTVCYLPLPAGATGL